MLTFLGKFLVKYFVVVLYYVLHIGLHGGLYAAEKARVGSLCAAQAAKQLIW